MSASKVHTHRGITIAPSGTMTAFGYGYRWEAYVDGRRIAADTLIGVMRRIDAALDENTTDSRRLDVTMPAPSYTPRVIGSPNESI